MLVPCIATPPRQRPSRTAAIRWETRALGLGWWQRTDGVWEVAGVDELGIREFSQRRAEMDEVRRALEERLGRRISHEEENTIALSTRADKQAVDPTALRKEWLSRADRVGLDVGSCFDRADRARPFEHLPEDLANKLFADLVRPGYRGVRDDEHVQSWRCNESDHRLVHR